MAGPLEVLGIPVTDELLARWSSWFAPAGHPFTVPKGSDLASAGRLFVPYEEPEVRDTFGFYGVDSAQTLRCIDYDEFMSLPRECRNALMRQQLGDEPLLAPSVRSWPSLRARGAATQCDGYRFLWWPALINGWESRVISRYVEDGRRPSRHRDVPASIWRSARTLLPGAHSLAGTFPDGSGPNCFATVMGAAGVAGAADQWMQRDPFEEWLAEATQPGGRDDMPGTLLIWRDAGGVAQHAAVTLGGGWALHKPSQGWMSPTKVLTVSDVILSARGPGRRLRRRRLLQSP